jgi:hypothetical protein
LEEVKQQAETILKNPNNQDEDFKKLIKMVDYSYSLDKDWEEFRIYFDDVHTGSCLPQWVTHFSLLTIF